MKKFEYKMLSRIIENEKKGIFIGSKQFIEIDEFEKMMNELGKEGWELVAVTNKPERGIVLENIYVFKRPLE